ncbi:aspartate/glutamate racemase family protein [Ramlibacter sp.]|uniref:aspartate/glutamate racemase family protein n=1 Tax=Ramlibacter sp. TaxID=1917967 RepID=UPI0017F722D7|nr:aspartate/glutamate racemase family protein [Ramlibacter sp.]MBA2673435.1 aspartate/glutamate racemase family protein [Ramlibacter sp.]
MGERQATRKLGIVGGVGWAATALYYEQLCRRSERMRRERNVGGVSSTLEMAIESLDLAHAVSLLGKEGDEASWSAFDAYHTDALLRLERCGAQVAVMASNTPHHRLAAIARGVRIAVLDLFALLAARCAAAGVRRALVLGTPTTMGSHVLHGAFAAAGVRSEVPQDARDRAELAALIDGLQKGHVPDAAQRIERLAIGCLGADAASGMVVLACTELPLAFCAAGTEGAEAAFTHHGVRYLDSALVHVEAALQACCADDSPGLASPGSAAR